MRNHVVPWALALSCALATEAIACEGPFSPWPIMRGLQIGDGLPSGKSGPPPSAGCDNPKLIECRFKGSFGYTYVFGEFYLGGTDRPRRELVAKIARRIDGAPLPFGVIWGDGRVTVIAKLHAARIKIQPEAGQLYAFPCSSADSDDDPLVFRFGPDGKLLELEEFVVF